MYFMQMLTEYDICLETGVDYFLLTMSTFIDESFCSVYSENCFYDHTVFSCLRKTLQSSVMLSPSPSST